MSLDIYVFMFDLIYPLQDLVFKHSGQLNLGNVFLAEV